MKTANQNFVVSANGSVFGAYAAVDAHAALLAYVADAGYPSIEDAATVLGETVEDFIDGTKVELLAPLCERIEIVNAALVIDENPHVAFDIAVDGNVVHSTLEWLDADLRGLVTADCHLDVSNDYLDAVETALSDDGELYDQASDDARSGVLGDIAEIVSEKLAAAVAELKQAA